MLLLGYLTTCSRRSPGRRSEDYSSMGSVPDHEVTGVRLALLAELTQARSDLGARLSLREPTSRCPGQVAGSTTHGTERSSGSYACPLSLQPDQSRVSTGHISNPVCHRVRLAGQSSPFRDRATITNRFIPLFGLSAKTGLRPVRGVRSRFTVAPDTRKDRATHGTRRRPGPIAPPLVAHKACPGGSRITHSSHLKFYHPCVTCKPRRSVSSRNPHTPRGHAARRVSSSIRSVLLRFS